MAAREDIILRILSESSQAKQDLVALKAAFDNALSALNEAAKQPGFDPISKDAIRLREEVVRLGKTFFTAFNQAKSSSKELSQVIGLVSKETKAAEVALKAEAKAIAEQNKITAAAARDAEATKRAEIKATADVSKAAEATRRAQIKATSDQVKAASKVEAETIRAAEAAKRQEIKASAVAARAAAKEAEAAAKSQKSSIGALTSAYRGLKTALASLGVALSARELVQFGKDALLTTVRLEAMKAQLNAASGSAEAGAETFRFVSEQANRLGQSYFVVGEATARFEAATRRSNLSLEERRFVLQSVLETARVLQLSEQRLNNTLLALEQIASKGTVSLEELRRQLGDNVPGAVQILARELNVSVKELFRMIEANELLSDVALPALARGFNETFGAGLDESLNTKAAKLGQIKNIIIDLKTAFAGGFADEFFRGLEIGQSQAAGLETVFGGLGSTVGVFVRTAVSATKATADFANALDSLTDEQKDTNEAALALNDSLRDVNNFLGLNAVAADVLSKSVRGDVAPAFNIFSAVLDEVAKANKLAVVAADLAELQASIKGISDELDRRDAVLDFVNSFEKLKEIGPISTDNLNLIIDASTRLIASFNEAGEKVPDVLREISAEARTVADDRALDRIAEKLGELIPPDATGSVDRLAESLRNLSTEGGVTAEALKPARDRVALLIREYEWAGQKVPADLLKIQIALERLAEKNSEVVENLVSGANQVESALEDLAAKQAQFTSELRKDAQDAADEALNLANVIADSISNSFGGLAKANEVQLDGLKEAIQKALDAYLLLGNQVPLILQELADEHGVLSSVAEKELEKQVKAAEKAAKEEKKAIEERIKNFQKLVEAIRDVTRELQPESRTDEVSDEIKKLQTELKSLESKAIFDPGDLERIQVIKDKLIDLRSELADLEQGFEQTSATVEDVDDAIRDLLEGNAEAFAQLSSSQRASIANLLSGLQSLAASGQASGGAVVDIFKQVASVLDGAGVNTEALYEAFGQLDGRGLNVAETMDRLLRAVEDSEEGQGSLADQTKKTTEELEKQKVALTKLVEEVEKLGVRGVAAMTPFRDILADTLDICERLKECVEDL